jgi:REP element-mobilizing transposase RayT
MKQGVKHTIKENKSYFLTITIVEWVDIFTRKRYSDLVVNSLKHCIAEKGLNVYAYVIMTNHLHLIANCNEPFQLKDTIRDFKKFTAKAIIKSVEGSIESKRKWMLKIFQDAAAKSKKHKMYKVWKTGNHAIELYNEKFSWIKINYIHQNPVKAGFVKKPSHWIYSSASNYEEKNHVVLPEVERITPPF